MKLTKETNILIVGLGVIGGGYAQALTKQGYTVNCITRSPSTIDYAVSHGMIAHGTTEIDAEMIGRADLVVFALYPHIFIEWLEKYQHLLKSGALITDVTGVKGCIVGRVQSMLRSDVEFIAAHPMAGRERSGVEYSDDKVFQGANFIVTPTEKNTPDAIATCKDLGKLLGFARITELTPQKHDEMIAFLSQLTHCIAITLMTCNDKKDMEKFTGDSFRDLTRIARINDVMWSELFIANKIALLEQMDLFMDKFNELKLMIETENVDEMRKMMRHSTERRALFDKK
jgi:prephenate dehydrogenase